MSQMHTVIVLQIVLSISSVRTVLCCFADSDTHPWQCYTCIFFKIVTYWAAS